jgi:hypothetical protein
MAAEAGVENRFFPVKPTTVSRDSHRGPGADGHRWECVTKAPYPACAAHLLTMARCVTTWARATTGCDFARSTRMPLPRDGQQHGRTELQHTYSRGLPPAATAAALESRAPIPASVALIFSAARSNGIGRAPLNCGSSRGVVGFPSCRLVVILDGRGVSGTGCEGAREARV